MPDTTIERPLLLILRHALEASSIGALIGSPLQHPPKVWLLGAAHDRFVSPNATLGAAACVRQFGGSPALTWVPGGHISSILMARHWMVPAIERALDALGLQPLE